MSEIWKWANLALAFAMELVALGVLGWWGWRTGSSTALRLLLAIGLPVVAIVLWSQFAAPNAAHSTTVRAVATKVLVLGGSALALWTLGQRIAAVGFVVVVVANLAIIRVGDLAA
jgi:hypothetical protein